MAGMRTVEEMLARAPDRYDITVIGAERHPNDNRILLSSVLAGDKSVADIVISPPGWYDAHNIRLIAGNAATTIDPAAKNEALASGEAVGYDKLLLATGSKPLAPPIPGLGLSGVHAFRDIADVEAMIAASEEPPPPGTPALAGGRPGAAHSPIGGG